MLELVKYKFSNFELKLKESAKLIIYFTFKKVILPALTAKA